MILVAKELYDEMARPSIHVGELGVHHRALADVAREAKAALDKFTDDWIRSMGVRVDLPNSGADIQRHYYGTDRSLLDNAGNPISPIAPFGITVTESALLPSGSTAYLVNGNLFVPKYNRYGDRITLSKPPPLYTRFTLGSREAARDQRKRDKLR